MIARTEKKSKQYDLIEITNQDDFDAKLKRILIFTMHTLLTNKKKLNKAVYHRNLVSNIDHFNALLKENNLIPVSDNEKGENEKEKNINYLSYFDALKIFKEDGNLDQEQLQKINLILDERIATNQCKGSFGDEIYNKTNDRERMILDAIIFEAGREAFSQLHLFVLEHQEYVKTLNNEIIPKKIIQDLKLDIKTPGENIENITSQLAELKTTKLKYFLSNSLEIIFGINIDELEKKFPDEYIYDLYKNKQSLLNRGYELLINNMISQFNDTLDKLNKIDEELKKTEKNLQKIFIRPQEKKELLQTKKTLEAKKQIYQPQCHFFAVIFREIFVLDSSLKNTHEEDAKKIKGYSTSECPMLKIYYSSLFKEKKETTASSLKEGRDKKIRSTVTFYRPENLRPSGSNSNNKANRLTSFFSFK